MKFNTVFCVAGVILLNLTGCLGQLDVCGQAPLNTKIAGGQNATTGSWPWQASINKRSEGHFWCSGSLINKEWVLTKASCVNDISMSELLVYLGRLSQNGSNPHEISRNVTEVIKPVLALLQLSSSVTFTDYIRPVCLAAAGSVFAAGTNSWVTGWGRINYTDYNLPDILQELETSVVGNIQCRAAYINIQNIADNMICAGDEEGKAPCLGDGGAPLVTKQDSVWIQIGLTLFNFQCGRRGFPTVYLRLSEFQDWISNYTSSRELESVSYTPIPSVIDGGSVNLLSFHLALTFSIIPLIFLHFF